MRSQKILDPNLEIARTYFMQGIDVGRKGPDGREVVLQNFSVKVNPHEVSESPLCEYMRIYYCDTLGVAPSTEFLEKDQRTVDVTALSKWLLDASPRTRVDALPQLLLTKEILRRFLSHDICIVSDRERCLTEALEERTLQLEATRRQLEESNLLNSQCLAEQEALVGRLEVCKLMEEELEQARKRIKLLEDKLATMSKAADTHAKAMVEKVEAARKETKEKMDAAYEKRMQITSQQLAFTQVRTPKPRKPKPGTMSQELARLQPNH